MARDVLILTTRYGYLPQVISELNGKNIEDVIAQGEFIYMYICLWSILIPADHLVICQASLVDQSILEALPELSEAFLGLCQRHF